MSTIIVLGVLVAIAIVIFGLMIILKKKTKTDSVIKPKPVEPPKPPVVEPPKPPVVEPPKPPVVEPPKPPVVEPPKPIFKCGDCSETFSSQKELDAHWSKYHDYSMMPKDLYACAAPTFPTSEQLSRAYKLHDTYVGSIGRWGRNLNVNGEFPVGQGATIYFVFDPEVVKDRTKKIRDYDPLIVKYNQDPRTGIFKYAMWVVDRTTGKILDEKIAPMAASWQTGGLSKYIENSCMIIGITESGVSSCSVSVAVGFDYE